MNVTDNELATLKGIVEADYHDGEHPVMNWVWSWSANPWEGTRDSRKFAGALSSLMKKGLADQSGAGKDACVTITQAGFDELVSRGHACDCHVCKPRQ
jgi:hypothetical protein